MEKVTISQLKNQLSAFLKKVRAGKTIVIFDRDEPIARLERIRAELHPDERLSRSKESVVEALVEERREAR